MTYIYFDDAYSSVVNNRIFILITKTNKKTGTTTTIEKKKVWDYTTNTLNQYTNVLLSTGTTSSGTTNTGTTSSGTTSSGTVNPPSEGGTEGGSPSLTNTWSDIPVDTWSLQWRLLYDRNGNLIGNTINNKRQFEYVYDVQNRLIQVNRYNDVTGKEVLISFSYDGLGRRTSKRVANVAYEYIYSGNDVIEEIQSNINPTTQAKTKKEMREYTYGARGTDDIVAVRYSTYTRVKKADILATTGDYYYEKNHLGSVIRITSSTGAKTDEYSYTVFWKAYRKNTNGIYKPVAWANDSSIWNTRLYTGREYDKEISLYYMRARFYDAGLGRFVSRDPIGMNDDINLYRYVANSPVIYTDIFGKEKKILNAIYNAKSVQVDLIARKLDMAWWWIGVHTFIKFTIRDNFWNIWVYSIWGHKSDDDMLDARFNDPSDAGWNKDTKGTYAIPTPSWMTDKEFATQLVNEAIFYDSNQKEYAALSTQDGDWISGNCNNFSTTMLMRASNYSSDILWITQSADPKGANPGLWEAFSPICTNN